MPASSLRLEAGADGAAIEEATDVMGRAPKYDLSSWTITSDWTDPVPVSVAEVRVFESWFGDLFDEFFEPVVVSSLRAQSPKDET